MRLVVGGLAVAALAELISVAWARRAPSVDPHQAEMDQVAERLRMFDASKRNGADFAHLPTWDRLSGADPYLVANVPGTSQVVGVLRGEDAIVVLDQATNETQRLPAPAGPTALAVAEDGAIYVAGELGSSIARFAWRGGKLEAAGHWDLGEIRAVRGLAVAPASVAIGARVETSTAGDWVYLAEEREGRLIALRLARRGGRDHIAERRDFGQCRGPIRLARFGARIVANCLLDHRLLLKTLDASGAPSDESPIVIAHDGPIWSFDAVSAADALLVAAAGVEDHPLDRTIGAFGYIDSFLFLYRIEGRTAHRETAINLSELGVVTPKAIALRNHPLAVTVSGYASDKLIDISFPAGTSNWPTLRTEAFVPGANAVARAGDRLVFANPLLDAWVVAKPSAPVEVLPVSASAVGSAERVDAAAGATIPAEPTVKLGEALFFTTLMAPFNNAEGALSRFTCETCHFEGYVDGRTHHTGRDDIHAVTKPLLGLFNNRPHFSRALDPDLTAVAFNEFRVAGAKSGHDPWFGLSTHADPWVKSLGVDEPMLSPEGLRKALMAFLIAFQHRPNPVVLGRAQFSDLERRGAALFRDRCESCHEARLASDQPTSRVPFERWESLVMAREGAIVWGEDAYVQSGILPYVHEKGARVPSLRRLYKKHPYFTNGSADTLDDVLTRARFLSSGFQHDTPKNPVGASTPSPATASSAAAETAPRATAETASSAAAETAPRATAENSLDEASRRALLAFLALL